MDWSISSRATIRRFFRTGFTAADIAEYLISYDANQPATDVQQRMVDHDLMMAEEEKIPDTTVTIGKSNVILKCKAVSGGVLQSLLADLSALEGVDMNDPSTLLTMGGSQQALAIQASEKLFTYCTGWGVINDPPEKMSEVSQLMGIRPDQPNMMRAAWIRYDLEADQNELGDIVGLVMALTFAQSGNGQEG